MVLAPRFRLGRFSSLQWAAVATSVACVFLLGRWAASPGYTERRTEPGIQLGSVIPPFQARHVDGSLAPVDFSPTGPSTLLYVLSPLCVWCEVNHHNIVALATEVSPHFRVLGVSPGGRRLKEHLDDYPLPFDVLVMDPPDTPAALDLSVTPQLALLGPDGDVERVWLGAWFGDTLGAVEDAFGIHLPGLPTSADRLFTTSDGPPPSTPPKLCTDENGLPYSEGAVEDIDGTVSRCHAGQWIPVNRP